MYECSSLSQIPKKEKEIGFTKIKFFLLLLILTIRLKIEKGKVSSLRRIVSVRKSKKNFNLVKPISFSFLGI